MPRKRKVAEQSGISEAPLEGLLEGSAPKTSTRRRAVKSSSRKVTDAAKKPPSKRTKSASSQSQAAGTPKEDPAVQTAPVEASQPESAGAAPESVGAALSSAVSIREQIAQLAYSYWEARGYQHGDPDEDWYRAEREILSRPQTKEPESWVGPAASNQGHSGRGQKSRATGAKTM